MESVVSYSRPEQRSIGDNRTRQRRQTGHFWPAPICPTGLADNKTAAKFRFLHHSLHRGQTGHDLKIDELEELTLDLKEPGGSDGVQPP